MMLETILTKTSRPLTIVLGHCTLPKQAGTRSNNKQSWQKSRKLEWNNFDKYSGNCYFMHPQTSWKILSAFVFRSRLPCTNETLRNVLHRMDRLAEALQLKMIVTLERLHQCGNSDYHFSNARLNHYLVSKIKSQSPELALLKECYLHKINFAWVWRFLWTNSRYLLITVKPLKAKMTLLR